VRLRPRSFPPVWRRHWGPLSLAGRTALTRVAGSPSWLGRSRLGGRLANRAGSQEAIIGAPFPRRNGGVLVEEAMFVTEDREEGGELVAVNVAAGWNVLAAAAVAPLGEWLAAALAAQATLREKRAPGRNLDYRSTVPGRFPGEFADESAGRTVAN
jgi:hypothetical protein